MPTEYKELEGWKVAQPGDGIIPNRWWELYNDPILNSLVEQVAISNQTIASAEAQFRQARALVHAARAGYFPSVSANASVIRSYKPGNPDSGNNGGSTDTNFQLPLDVTWELDLWGRIRREVEASQANVQASAADLAAVTLSTQAELVSDYFQLRVVDTQKKLLDATTTIYRKSFELNNKRYEAGVTAKLDVLQAETQLKGAEAQMIDSGVQRAQLEHAIALLMGKPPAAFSLPATSSAIVIPLIPTTGLPSELLERRPDIASSERRMAAANAQIGIAKAAYFPTISLSASAGLTASSLSSWFTWPSHFWSIGPAMAATLFDGGLRKALSYQAWAAYDTTVAAYRETVLTAFQEVEDNLAALRILEEEALVQAQTIQASKQVVSISMNQYLTGTVAYLNVIVAQSTALANERTSLVLLGRRLTASILLVKALGGGWIPEKQN
jgi:NodT family efflux transporter outer membrane factor (OMF) lipoprotein